MLDEQKMAGSVDSREAQAGYELKDRTGEIPERKAERNRRICKRKQQLLQQTI